MRVHDGEVVEMMEKQRWVRGDGEVAEDAYGVIWWDDMRITMASAVSRAPLACLLMRKGLKMRPASQPTQRSMS